MGDLSDLILGDTKNNPHLDSRIYNGRILSFDDNGHLLYLSVNFTSSKPHFYVHGQRDGENAQIYHDSKIKSNEVLKLLELLNKTPLIETDKRLLY